MSTTTRKSLALAGAGATLAVAAATAAFATAPSGETLTPLGRGALVMPANVNRKVRGGRVKLQTKGKLDVVMLEITLAPGGSGGWHEHAGPLVNVVKQGTLTIVDPKCNLHQISAGHGAISDGSLDRDENTGTTPVTFDVTFLIPHGAATPRIDRPAPAGCNK